MALSISEYEKLKEINNSKQKRNISFEEANIQAAFFTVVAMLPYDLDKTLFHIPNEGKRNPKFVKKSGIKRGVADVFLSKANSRYHGLYIEFKTEDGTQSKDQIEFQKQVEQEGYKYVVCRSASQGIEVLKEYLKDR